MEGAELEVVKSLLDLIKRDRPIILVEILPVYSAANTFRMDRQDELEQIFADAGYVALRVEKTPTVAYAGLKPVKKIGIHSDLTLCDYVVLPREQLAEVQHASKVAAEGKRTKETAL